MKPLRFFSFLSLDLRSLALFRFALGVVLICDWFTRIAHVNDFYTDKGVLSRSALLGQFGNPLHFSVFNMAGSSLWIYTLCFIALFFYLAFLWGYRTPWATFFSWVFFVSYSARAPMIAHGGDDLIRMALFWMMFLPSNAHFSVDRALGKSNSDLPAGIFNVASFALMIQLIAMYFSTSLLKWHPVWIGQGTALFYALQLDQFVSLFGTWLRLLPAEILRLMTFGTMWVELVVPLLVFVPVRNSFFRWVALLTLIFFHFGIFLTFQLASFPWVCMVYWLIFIPASFWDAWLEKLKTLQSKAVIFYDGECRYCLKMVSLIRVFLVLPFVQVRTAQENSRTDAVMKKENSWLVQLDSKPLVHGYRAFLNLLSLSPFKGLSRVLALSHVTCLGERIYQWQASKRPLMGSLLGKLHPQNVKTRSSFLAQGLVLVLLSVAMYWNVAVHDPDDDWTLPAIVDQIGSTLRLHQKWNLFAPYPWREDGWLVVEGQLNNGRIWDIHNNLAVSFEKPDDVAARFDGVSWLKYIVNIWHKDYSQHRLHFGRFLCRRWNEGRDVSEHVTTFKIFYMLEVSSAPGEPVNQPRKEEIWSHDCFQ